MKVFSLPLFRLIVLLFSLLQKSDIIIINYLATTGWMSLIYSSEFICSWFYATQRRIYHDGFVQFPLKRGKSKPESWRYACCWKKEIPKPTVIQKPNRWAQITIYSHSKISLYNFGARVWHISRLFTDSKGFNDASTLEHPRRKYRYNKK